MAKSMGSLVLALLIVVMLMGLASHYGSAACKHMHMDTNDNNASDYV